MPITVSWDDAAHTAIRYDFTDPWTWEELLVALQQDDAMITSVDYPVHLIFNGEQTASVPPNPISRFKNISTIISPGTGQLILVGQNLWFQKVGELFYKVYGHRTEGLTGVQTASTLAEARAIIAKHQQTQT